MPFIQGTLRDRADISIICDSRYLFELAEWDGHSEDAVSQVVTDEDVVRRFVNVTCLDEIVE